MIYLLVWLISATLQFGFLYFYFSKDWGRLLGEIFIQNLFLAGIFIVLWFGLRYLRLEFQKPIAFFLNHLIYLVLVLVVWNMLSKFTSYLIFGKIYPQNYIQTIVPVKGFLGVFSYLLFVFFIYLDNYYTSFLEKQENEKKLYESLKKSELNLLKSQMNPHFIFNSLNSISSLTIIDPEKAHEMVIKLSDFLRYTVGYSQTQKVSLFKELEMCRAYLDIEKIRFGDKINVDFEIGKDTENVEIPSMLLQTLFENAIKHGIYNSLNPERILFKSNLENDRLELIMENTFDKSGCKQIGTKTGLKNIKERLRLIYQNLAIFETQVIDNKFVVWINIPV